MTFLPKTTRGAATWASLVAATCAALLMAWSQLAWAADEPPEGDDADSGAPPNLDAEVQRLEAELEREHQPGEVVAPPAPGPAKTAPESRRSAAVEPSEERDEVSVTAARIRRTPGSLHVVGPEVLERFKYDDPHATLQLVPGVYVRQEDGFGLRPNIGIRGAISDRSKKVALMQDGVLFGPAPYSAPAAYYFPVIGRMTEMRVIKGPAAVKYGPQSIGGAIDLRTRSAPASAGGALDVAGGRFGFAKLHAHYGARTAQNAFLIEGVHLRSSGFKELAGGGDTGFHRNEWMFKGSHDFSPRARRRHELSLQLTYSDEASNETYLGLTDEDFRESPNRRYAASRFDRMRWHRTSVILEHHLAPTDSLAITTTAYRHDLSRSWNKVNHFAEASLFDVLIDPAAPRNQAFYQVLSGQADGMGDAQQLFIGPNARDYVSQGIQTRGVLDLETGSVRHRVEWGARFHNDRIRRRHSEEAFSVSGGEPSPAGGPSVVTTSNEAETFALALHATDELRLGGLTLTPGVRLELIASRFRDHLRAAAGEAAAESDRSLGVLLPGVGVHYAITDELGVLGGVHRGMSPPAPGANEDVDAEISINYEGGARYVSGLTRVELIGYYNDYDNLTDVCTLSGGCNAQNLDTQFDAGRARIYGFEAFAEDSLLFGSSLRLPLRLSYTLTRTEFLETFQSGNPIFGDVEAGDELPYVPRHQGRASVGLEVDTAGGYVAGSYVGRMREQSGAGPIDAALATEALLTLDVGLHYDVLDELRLYGQVRNLLGQQEIVSRRPYGARPNAPRWVQVGLRLSLD